MKQEDIKTYNDLGAFLNHTSDEVRAKFPDCKGITFRFVSPNMHAYPYKTVEVSNGGFFGINLIDNQNVKRRKFLYPKNEDSLNFKDGLFEINKNWLKLSVDVRFHV